MLEIPGKTGSDGVLILGNAGAVEEGLDVASRAFLSYEFDEASDRFVIESRELVAGDNPFGEDAVLLDTDFYFAWVDFTQPICPDPECPGGAPPSDALFRRGDPDNSGAGNIADAVSVLNFLFGGGADPACLEAADTNDDGEVNVTDPVSLLNFLFGGGPPPPAPGPDGCGADPEDSVHLGCEQYTTC